MQRPFGVHIWTVGPCLFCRASVGGQVLSRTLEHVAVLGKFVVVSRYVSGHMTGTAEGEPFGIRTGNIVLRDFARPFVGLQYPSVIEAVMIPHRILDLYGAEIPALRVMREGAPEAQPLASMLNDIFGRLRGEPHVFSLRALEHLLACAKGSLLAPPNQLSARLSARSAQRAAINRFIEENLGQLDLSAERILPEFGVSRATLYRLFEDEGGVRKYIVDRRLFRALLDISDAGRRRGKIQEAAKRWGFSSAANFNRSIRQVFGGTPGSLFSEPAQDRRHVDRRYVDSDGLIRDA